MFDVLVSDPVEERAEDPYTEVTEFAHRSQDERWAYFAREAGRCIRCYACREACPMCYCEECFVDSSRPRWIEKSLLDPPDVQVWHIIRSIHQAGRCVDCGACERACPMEIKMRFMTQKLNQDIKELFSFETGIDPEAPPPLATWSFYDKQDFIR